MIFVRDIVQISGEFLMMTLFIFHGKRLQSILDIVLSCIQTSLLTLHELIKLVIIFISSHHCVITNTENFRSFADEKATGLLFMRAKLHISNVLPTALDAIIE